MERVSAMRGLQARFIFLEDIFAGIQLTDTAYKSFTVKPETDTFESVDCTFPVKGGMVHVKWDEKILSVESSVSGGTLIYCGKEYLLEPGKTVTTTK